VKGKKVKKKMKTNFLKDNDWYRLVRRDLPLVRFVMIAESYAEKP